MYFTEETIMTDKNPDIWNYNLKLKLKIKKKPLTSPLLQNVNTCYTLIAKTFLARAKFSFLYGDTD